MLQITKFQCLKNNDASEEMNNPLLARDQILQLSHLLRKHFKIILFLHSKSFWIPIHSWNCWYSCQQLTSNWSKLNRTVVATSRSPLSSNSHQGFRDWWMVFDSSWPTFNSKEMSFHVSMLSSPKDDSFLKLEDTLQYLDHFQNPAMCTESFVQIHWCAAVKIWESPRHSGIIQLPLSGKPNMPCVNPSLIIRTRSIFGKRNVLQNNINWININLSHLFTLLLDFLVMNSAAFSGLSRSQYALWLFVLMARLTTSILEINGLNTGKVVPLRHHQQSSSN